METKEEFVRWNMLSENETIEEFPRGICWKKMKSKRNFREEYVGRKRNHKGVCAWNMLEENEIPLHYLARFIELKTEHHTQILPPFFTMTSFRSN